MRVDVIAATENPVGVISRAAGTCYGKDDVSENRVRNCLKAGHMSVFEHASATLRIEGVSRACSHQLVRHRLASFCVTGDTEIMGMGQKRWTAKTLYDWQFDSKRKSRIGMMDIRSVDESTNTIVPNKIKGVYLIGEKQVYEVTTESGRALKCTADHKIYTPDGYRELQDISVGDYVYSNGKELLENEDWLRWYYLEQNHTRKETAEFIGCCESIVNRAFRKFGIVKPRSMYPNRKPGRGVKGMFSAEELERMSRRKSGENNPSYKKDRSELSVRGGYTEANVRFSHDSCELCGSTEHIELHHKNKDPRDNRRGNVMQLCSKCHKLWHRVGSIGVFRDKVVSVKRDGVEDVYDIEMHEPFHNFVANGIVVHNCQESQRYCRYGFEDEDWYVTPPAFATGDALESAFHRHMGAASGSYFAAIERGVKPEDARYLLPEATKTNLVMTANLREMYHIFAMRDDKAAQWEIRELAREIRRALSEVSGQWAALMELGR